MIEQFVSNKVFIELIFIGLACLGLFMIVIFSSPVEKLKNKIEEYKEKKRQKRIEERREANQPLADGLKELSSKVENLQNDMNTLKKSDQEQLRQLMDQIYFKHLNEKTISQHNFERYESLQNSYEAEGGNGTYAIRWEEVKTWTKTK